MIRRISAFAILSFFASVVGCTSGSNPNDSQPHHVHDPRACSFYNIHGAGQSTFYFFSAATTLDGCHIVLKKSDATLAFGATVVLLRDSSTGPTLPTTQMQVADTYFGNNLGSSNVEFMDSTTSTTNPDGNWKRNLTVSGQPGLYYLNRPSAPFDSAFRDSVTITVYNVRTVGQAKAADILLGVTDPAGHTLYGPTAIPAGDAATWWFEEAHDSGAYTHQWLVDGTPISTGAFATFGSWAYHGSHTVTTIATRADETADTVVNTINALIKGYVSGDQSLLNGDLGAWTANISGDHGSNTCSWYIDDVNVQNGSCSLYSSFTDGPSSHEIRFDVADGDGGTGSSPGWGVAVHNCGTGCDYSAPKSVAPAGARIIAWPQKKPYGGQTKPPETGRSK
jgi:hypothetical protein